MLTTGSVLHSVFEIYIYVISYWLGKWYSNSWVWSEAVKRGPYSRRRALFFPIRTDLGKHIAYLFYMLFLFICFFFFSIKMIFIRNGFVYVTLLLNQFMCRTVCLIPRPRYLALVKWFWVRWVWQLLLVYLGCVTKINLLRRTVRKPYKKKATVY